MGYTNLMQYKNIKLIPHPEILGAVIIDESRQQRAEMQLNRNDIIKDGRNIYGVFCILGSVIYVKPVPDVNSSPTYELEEVLKHYRKIEIMEK